MKFIRKLIKFIFNIMSRKYIRQQIYKDFVYPNNDQKQYDVDNIVHDINNNNVSGVVNSFSATTVTTTGITFSYNITWDLNDAEPFINNINYLQLFSIHILPAEQDYYKPWVLCSYASNVNTGLTTSTVSGIVNITPSQFGLDSFTSGKYYYEIRFIGHRCVYPVISYVDVTIPSSLTINVRDVAGTPQNAAFLYSVNGASALPVNGYYGLTPLPTGCTSGGTYTGLTAGDVVVFSTSVECVMNGQSGSSCPSSSGNSITYTHIVASDTDEVSITVDTETIPASLTINARDVGSLLDTSLFYTINSGSTFNVPGYTGSGPLPSSCSELYTITGLTIGDTVEFGTSIECIMNGSSGTTCPSSSGTNLTYTYTVVAKDDDVALTIDTATIPATVTLYGRDVAGTRQNIAFFYNINGGGNLNVPGYTGSSPLPASCTSLTSITGVKVGDVLVFGTSLDCVMNGNNTSTCPNSSGVATTYTYTILTNEDDIAITVDSQSIP